MSIRAMNWAWGQRLQPTQKLLLMALSDAANDLDECWPSVPTIAYKCCVSERTVRRILAELTEYELFTIIERFRPDGSQRSNSYKLRIQDDKMAPSPDSSGATKMPIVTGGDVVDGSTRTTTEPKAESPQQPGCGNNVSQETPELDLSSLVRLVPIELPSILAKTLEVPMQAQQLLDELAGRLKKETINNPIAYMATLVDRVKNGLFEPQLGLRIAESRKRKLDTEERERLRHAQNNVANEPTKEKADTTKIIENLRRALNKNTDTDSETDPDAKE